MNAVIETMLTRRSVRAYADKPVEPELLKVILNCGLHAPTGHNSQNVRLFTLAAPEHIAALNVIVQRELSAMEPREGSVMKSSILRARTPNYHFIHRAPVLISAAAPRTGENSMAECAAAVENMLLAAHALGLAACWSNQPHWLNDLPALRELFAPLGMRDDEVILASLSVGHPAAPLAPAPARKEGRLLSDIAL